jgi:voltage-gated potassium channel Kch
MGRSGRWLFAFALAQGGEFAFVLASFATQSGVLTEVQAGPVVLVVALSMLVTPLLLLFLERVVMPRVAETKPERAHDAIPEHDDPVIIAGFGRFGQIIGRLLRANGYGTTILDHDANIIEFAGRVGLEVHYGDASRLELLHAAGCARAKIFVLAVDDRERSLRIAQAVRTHFPHLHIIARAWDRVHYFELKKAGVQVVLRETFGSALEAGEAMLRGLGMRAHRAHRAAQAYRGSDERALGELEKLWGGDEKTYFEAVRRASTEAERLLRGAKNSETAGADEAFDNDALRAEQEP